MNAGNDGEAIEVVAGPVVAGRGAGIGVAGGDLDVPQRHPGIEGGGDQAVAKGVRRDALVS